MIAGGSQDGLQGHGAWQGINAMKTSLTNMKKGSGDVKGHMGQERNGKETDCQRKTSNEPTQPRDRHTSCHLVMSTEQSERGRSTGGVCMGGGLKISGALQVAQDQRLMVSSTESLTVFCLTEGLHSVLGGFGGQKQTVFLLICTRPDGAR